MIHDTDAKMSDEEFVRELFQMNLPYEGDERTRLMAATRVATKVGPRDKPLIGRLVECCGEVYSRLLQRGRVFVGWASCRVMEASGVTRCFRCFCYGHPAKYCLETVQTCGHCTGSGHLQADCPKRNQPPTCPACKKFGRGAGHSYRSTECHEFKRAAAIVKARTNYE